MLFARSHHSSAFFVHSVIYIGHYPSATSLLQCQDHKPLFSACRTSLVVFILLFMFLISSISSAHLHRHALILDRLLISMVFSTLVLKTFLFSKTQSLSLHSHLSLPQVDGPEFDQSVFGSGSVTDCGRLSQPRWLLGRLCLFSYFLSNGTVRCIVSRPVELLVTDPLTAVNNAQLIFVLAEKLN